MKRFIISIIFILSITNVFASKKDDQIVYAMLMNQIQFSLQTVQYYKDRLVLDQEYNNIICKIDKTKLKDENNKAITAYSNMLGLLTNLKLQENEKIFVTQEAEREKSQALYKCLEGAAIPAIASIYQLGQGISSIKQDPTAIGQIISGSASALYTGVSAFFNYKNTINTVENRLRKDLFRLEQEDLKLIDGERESLFKTYSEFISKYDIPKQYEIKEDQMRWLVETLDKADTASKINLLEEKRNIFAVFTPFWFELGCAYQELGNLGKAKDCYQIFERQKLKYSIIDNDSYYTELAKNMIQISMEENNITNIRKYLSIIENDTTASNESSNRFYSAGIHYYLKDFDEAQKQLKLIIDDNREFVPQAREFLQLITVVKNADDITTNLFLLGQLKIVSDNNVKEVVISKKGDSTVFSDAVNFFFGSEEEKVFYYDKLVFSLPIKIGEKYTLGIVINGKYYDSLPYVKDDKIYYFINYELDELMEDHSNFYVFLIDEKGKITRAAFTTEYFNSKKTRQLNEAFKILSVSNKEYSMDISNISQISISSFLNKFKELKSENKFKNASDNEKAKKVSNCYESSVKELLKPPYLFKQNITIKNNYYIFCYGIKNIETQNKIYSFSKYGDLKTPEEKPLEINNSLRILYDQALSGDSESAYKMGMFFLNGDEKKKNYIEAINMFKIAIYGNEKMNAFYQLAFCFEKGYGADKNYDRAKFYYQKAADLGHEKAKKKIK